MFPPPSVLIVNFDPSLSFLCCANATSAPRCSALRFDSRLSISQETEELDSSDANTEYMFRSSRFMSHASAGQENTGVSGGAKKGESILGRLDLGRPVDALPRFSSPTESALSWLEGDTYGLLAGCCGGCVCLVCGPRPLYMSSCRCPIAASKPA
ncbi:hypothetical protein KC19_VG021500 [Ceratodon purpureus]|uniref:Uncharacterized protein n=1 Tax=Ceratodon purpureus TaxID=3225 RepID=A0A8T0HL83_CERPU|nr:hypothetical protein KC19_VG021500 [Ceratodon purpureus]